MANPVQVAKDLHETLNAVLDSVSMAPKLKQRIEAVQRKVAEITKFLENVNDNYVPLDVAESQNNIEATLHLWRKAPPGVIKANSKVYDELINKAETLRTLQSAGIDITSIRKFSESEIMLAKELGDHFQDYNKRLYKFVVSLNRLISSVGTFKSRVRFSKKDHQFFSLLAKFNVIEKFKVKLFIHTKDNFVDSTFSEIENLSNRQNNDIRIKFLCENTENQHFVRGDWFNAYAYHIIDDQLSRNHIDYEIFTRVSYNAPSDIIRSGGDFDIIAMFGSKVLLVECKSGELKQSDERDDFEKISEKTNIVQKVFNLTRTNHYDYKFLLIYNHFSNNPEEIEQKLDGTGILPVKLDKIRGTINELFGSDQKVQTG